MVMWSTEFLSFCLDALSREILALPSSFWGTSMQAVRDLKFSEVHCIDQGQQVISIISRIQTSSPTDADD